MLLTWTGAYAGASCTTTRPPFFRSMTIRSSAGMSFQELAGAWATTSLGVGNLDGGVVPAARCAAAWAAKSNGSIIFSPFAATLAEHRPRRYPRFMYLATLMLLGSGELGREFTIAAKRVGCR